MLQGSPGEVADVCIVGSGPAGLTLARALGAAGRRVWLLESGGAFASSQAQRLNDGEVEGEPYAGLQSTRHRRLGGTVNTWNVTTGRRPGAKYAPLGRRDLADWPLGWDELEPWYAAAQEVCGLGPFQYGAEAWASAARPPFPLDGTGLTSGVYQFGHAECFTRDLVREIRGHAGVRLATGATVCGLRAERGRVRAVRVVDERGARSEIEARAVILACGAVENARLLLLQAREGPSPFWLGRGFMEHARDFSLLLTPGSPELFARAAFYDLHASEGGCLIGGHLAVTDEARAELDLPNAGITLVPRRRRGLADRLLGRRRAPRRYGWSSARSPRRSFDAFHLVVNLEQRPHPENRIELARRADPFGNPLPRLLLRWTDAEQARLERLRERLAEWLRVAGLGRLHLVHGRRPDLSAHHHAGTTRMANDAADGVTDPHGRAFGYDNLYLAGASVFPSAGFANPTLTIVALALRLARHVDEALGTGG